MHLVYLAQNHYHHPNGLVYRTAIEYHHARRCRNCSSAAATSALPSPIASASSGPFINNTDQQSTSEMSHGMHDRFLGQQPEMRGDLVGADQRLGSTNCIQLILIHCLSLSAPSAVSRSRSPSATPPSPRNSSTTAAPRSPKSSPTTPTGAASTATASTTNGSGSNGGTTRSKSPSATSRVELEEEEQKSVEPQIIRLHLPPQETHSAALPSTSSDDALSQILPRSKSHSLSTPSSHHHITITPPPVRSSIGFAITELQTTDLVRAKRTIRSFTHARTLSGSTSKELEEQRRNEELAAAASSNPTLVTITPAATLNPNNLSPNELRRKINNASLNPSVNPSPAITPTVSPRGDHPPAVPAVFPVVSAPRASVTLATVTTPTSPVHTPQIIGDDYTLILAAASSVTAAIQSLDQPTDQSSDQSTVISNSVSPSTQHSRDVSPHPEPPTFHEAKSVDSSRQPSRSNSVHMQMPPLSVGVASLHSTMQQQNQSHLHQHQSMQVQVHGPTIMRATSSPLATTPGSTHSAQNSPAFRPFGASTSNTAAAALGAGGGGGTASATASPSIGSFARRRRARAAIVQEVGVVVQSADNTPTSVNASSAHHPPPIRQPSSRVAQSHASPILSAATAPHLHGLTQSTSTDALSDSRTHSAHSPRPHPRTARSRLQVHSVEEITTTTTTNDISTTPISALELTPNPTVHGGESSPEIQPMMQLKLDTGNQEDALIGNTGIVTSTPTALGATSSITPTLTLNLPPQSSPHSSTTQSLSIPLETPRSQAITRQKTAEASIMDCLLATGLGGMGMTAPPHEESSSDDDSDNDSDDDSDEDSNNEEKEEIHASLVAHAHALAAASDTVTINQSSLRASLNVQADPSSTSSSSLTYMPNRARIGGLVRRSPHAGRSKKNSGASSPNKNATLPLTVDSILPATTTDSLKNMTRATRSGVNSRVTSRRPSVGGTNSNGNTSNHVTISSAISSTNTDELGISPAACPLDGDMFSESKTGPTSILTKRRSFSGTSGANGSSSPHSSPLKRAQTGLVQPRKVVSHASTSPNSSSISSATWLERRMRKMYPKDIVGDEDEEDGDEDEDEDGSDKENGDSANGFLSSSSTSHSFSRSHRHSLTRRGGASSFLSPFTSWTGFKFLLTNPNFLVSLVHVILPLIILWQALFIPMRLAFGSEEKDAAGASISSSSTHFKLMSWLDLPFDLIFLVGVICTDYIDMNTRTLKPAVRNVLFSHGGSRNRRSASSSTSSAYRFQVYTQLTCDVLSSLPYEYLEYFFSLQNLWTIPTMATQTSMHALVRLPRLFRLQRLFQSLDYYETRNLVNTYINPTTFRLCKLGVLMYLVAHLAGCGYVFISYIEGCPEGNEWVVPPNIRKLGISTQYLHAVHWGFAAMTGNGSGVETPQTGLEHIFALIVLLIGVSTYATLIGNLSSIIQQMNSKQEEFRDKMTSINSLMMTYKLPADVQHRVKSCFQYLFNVNSATTTAASAQGDTDDTSAAAPRSGEWDVLQHLPSYLRNEVLCHINGEIIHKVPLFRGCSDGFMRSLVPKLRPEIVIPGDYIIREGEVARDMYLVRHGQMEVIAHGVVVATLSDGSYVGEVAIIFESKRTASVRAVSFCDILVLSKDDFDSILSLYPDVQKSMKMQATMRRNARSMQDKELTEKNHHHHHHHASSGDVPPQTPRGGDSSSRPAPNLNRSVSTDLSRRNGVTSTPALSLIARQLQTANANANTNAHAHTHEKRVSIDTRPPQSSLPSSVAHSKSPSTLPLHADTINNNNSVVDFASSVVSVSHPFPHSSAPVTPQGTTSNAAPEIQLSAPNSASTTGANDASSLSVASAVHTRTQSKWKKLRLLTRGQ